MHHITSPDDELKDLAPTLAGMSRENPFTVPDHYFDTLHASIQDRIAAEKLQPSWILWLQVLIQPRVSVSLAAVCVVLLFVINNLAPIHQTVKPVVALQEITMDDLAASGYLEIIEEHDVLENYLSGAAVEPGNTVSPEQKSIEEYLLENNTDVSALINEL